LTSPTAHRGLRSRHAQASLIVGGLYSDRVMWIFDSCDHLTHFLYSRHQGWCSIFSFSPRPPGRAATQSLTRRGGGGGEKFNRAVASAHTRRAPSHDPPRARRPWPASLAHSSQISFKACCTLNCEFGGKTPPPREREREEDEEEAPLEENKRRRRSFSCD